MSLNSDLQQAEARSAALLEASRENNQQLATGLQPVRSAIGALQQAETAEFRAVAEQSDKSRPPLGAAIADAQNARDAEFHTIAQQLNIAAGLPVNSPK